MTRILLVGCGKMGGAMLEGWLERGAASADIIVVEPNGPVAARDGLRVVKAAGEVPADFSPDVVVLAVKPQMMDAALPPLVGYAGKAVVLSIAAGKTLAYFGKALGEGTAVVRAMPNTPAAVGRGISVAVPNAKVSAEQRAACGALLSAVGAVEWVEDEGLMDAVTAVSGSGPAYVFLLAETLAEAGVAAGLPRPLAEKLARATVVGSGELLNQSPETAAKLRENVTSPNGTTFAALQVLRVETGMPGLMTRAVAAAAARSKELAG
ncbi:MAG TPA: pyrroline-5-carboxylate reductase [Magnetospirillaceae bacterium]